MIRMSKLTDYGTLVMTYLARHSAGVHNAAEIAAATQISLPTVSKILKILAKESLLVSHRGIKGGYSLARAPESITLMEIIDAIEGPIGLTECSSSPGLCEQETSCSVRVNWMKINSAVRQALTGVTLADMAQPTLAVINADRLYARGRVNVV
ncbi:MAG: SUF system Fe-S cluster assembly regulator [Azospira oryzae]|uniref:SUF system Fe-S cluster assembly regulator n=1 Tax=Pelomicrobium methylotrophicum TaxID=2602750 RepID=A0A5C7ELH0_9PROT|nr:SUF system Fe-S cluster assembly regulator [Pelomicrobium methylotrophicum]PZP56430.1 MAG: SUF system Fe-S cluster assembly regulator [Azospira oryzae]PZP78472.1 MAG: SUF system Fe-S cluster assembly regulator [Azospira oryzae]TXF12386.1 SUF system Fe-S cluster assembly regulator [Pelomicrobium methylotrophicum]